jgi:hypothetical protein
MPSRRYQGWWACSYSLSQVDRPPSLQEMAQILEEVKGHETGWPVWLSLNRDDMRPYPAGGAIECWLKDTPHGDFWRADPRGYLFLIRNLQEDYAFSQSSPGSAFDLTLPVWRTGECLLHASRMAARLNAETVDLSMTWSGLRGRTLLALAGDRHLFPGRVSQEDQVETVVSVSASAIPDTLPELVKALTSRLYASFDFFDPPDEMYTTELHRLRTGQR